MIDERQIDVGGCRTRVLEAGAGDRDVVFLHGVGARADRWRTTLTDLSGGGLRMHAFDFPGHGFACKGRLSVSVPQLAQFVATALDALKIDNVVVVGTSLGGNVAARFFLDQPERVDALALVGSLGLAPIGAERASGIAERMVRLDPESIRAKLHHAVFEPGTITDAWVEEEHAINNSPGAAESLASYARYFREGIDADVVGDEFAARATDLRLALIWGEADRTVPLAIAEDFVARCPTARLHVLPGAAHQPYLEQPAGFEAALRELLDSARRRSAGRQSR